MKDIFDSKGPEEDEEENLPTGPEDPDRQPQPEEPDLYN